MVSSSLATLLLVATTGAAAPTPDTSAEAWSLHLLPRTLIYRSYAAGPREPRMSSAPFFVRTESRSGWLWDSTLGARLPVFRFGSADARAAFTEELRHTVTSLAARYHDESAADGRWHRPVVAAHPSPQQTISGQEE